VAQEEPAQLPQENQQMLKETIQDLMLSSLTSRSVNSDQPTLVDQDHHHQPQEDAQVVAFQPVLASAQVTQLLLSRHALKPAPQDAALIKSFSCTDLLKSNQIAHSS